MQAFRNGLVNDRQHRARVGRFSGLPMRIVLGFLAPLLLAYAAAVALVNVLCQALLNGLSGITILIGAAVPVEPAETKKQQVSYQHN